MPENDQNDRPESADARSDLPRIAGYRLVRRLGLGGMATVYLAVQESLDREVAIKVMRPARQLDEEQTIRFEHEARIIAKLEHPGIVVIHEVGRTLEGDLYYVMPYLAKGDLSVRDYRDDEPGLIALLRALLDALGYAHARGIVHRDVKPENVLFDNADRPQLADFGIALAQREVNSRITGDGLVIGTSAQMSPEQARADPVDDRSDLYSLGILAFELLTGYLPYQSPDALALALMHAQDPIPKLPEEKSHWQGFINRAMAKRPEDRFRNAQAMQRALDPIERHVRHAAGLPGRLRRAVNKRPSVLVAVGALVAVAIVATVLPLMAGLRGHAAAPPPASDRAPELAAELADAQSLLSRGALLQPPGANAAEHFLAVLAVDPDSSLARSGLEAVLTAATDPIVAAANADRFDEVRTGAARARTVAGQAGLGDSPAWQALRDRSIEALATRARAHLADADRGLAADAMALMRELGASDALLQPLDGELRNLPQPGVAISDPGGPPLLLVPARYQGATLSAPVLMMRNEVSRDEYAAFAAASGRPASRCRNSLSPLRLFDRRDWKDPGFRQTGDDPVVCVSFDDARAYAAWLGRRTGMKYRLPTNAEWLQAERSVPRKASACARGNVRDSSARGIALHHDCNDGYANTAPTGRFRPSELGLHDLLGNVSEWSAECGTASNALARSFESDTCPRRAVLGMSWQDGPDIDPRSARLLPSDRGYDDVGFRLVREL
ncbi:bifunctional serine/threonine-protein kinase/formylglycine-generating enzyme family protein [Dokdonella immobilis]|uniref:Serine/threonine protein kinase n=1 Tax=Dokdonella immobilis TaxID=578942 RepID=A0A1I4XGJ6_9GAMM|nr:bifunctional serine/threonine-protein kinase/formylglycine-generating enzyme family protein [Dokdonella immobilis]SFN24420.1 Serine/threonine protein kinase [Dokdonella immobilis]